jgi:quinoprotein glucose dehydrogenase
MDIPCAPILADITINGQTIKAVAQPTKQAFLYVFDRTNGKPIWPIEERPVEQSNVPGEKTSATQPFPTKPPAYDRQGSSVNDLIDFTPELRAEAQKIVSRYKLGPIFTPPVVSKIEGPLGTLASGISNGGTNWPGGSYDPETHILYVFSQTTLVSLGLVPGDPKLSGDFGWIQGIATSGPRLSGGAGAEAGSDRAPGAASADTSGVLAVQGLPLVKPPYGRISAIDMNKGEILWTIAHGETPDNIKNHPALKGVTIPRTGRPGAIGTLVTKSLLIAGEAGTFTTPNGQKGAMLRAYDKASGKEVGAVYMPTQQSGTPMTYMLGGKQYIVVAIGGQGYTAELRAFRLPN